MSLVSDHWFGQKGLGNTGDFDRLQFSARRLKVWVTRGSMQREEKLGILLTVQWTPARRVFKEGPEAFMKSRKRI